MVVCLLQEEHGLPHESLRTIFADLIGLCDEFDVCPSFVLFYGDLWWILSCSSR